MKSRLLPLLALLAAPLAVRAEEATQGVPAPSASTASAPAPSPGPEAPVTGTSISTSGSSGSLLSNVTASFRSEFYGPSITDWSDKRPNVGSGKEADPKSPIYAKNKFTVAYKLDPTWSTGVGLAVYTTSTKGASFKDPYAFIRNSKLINAAGYNMDLAFRTYAGVSADSKKYGTPVTFRLVHDSSYRIAGSRFVADLYTEFDYLVNKTRKVGAREFASFITPNLNYELSSTVSLNLAAKIWTYYSVGQKFFGQSVDPILLSPGVTWNPIKAVSLNPYLDFSPGQGFKPKYTTVGFNLNWKMI